MNGQTPGKRLTGIRVIKDNGAPVDWPSSLLRNLLRVVDFLPMLYGFGLLSMLFNRNFKRLGDIAASTLVVYVERFHTRPALAEAMPSPPMVNLTLEEQQAIISFAERAQTLSPQRSVELAGLAQILGDAQKTRVTPDYLISLANWLAGRR